ncbi:hypothetical protein BDW60DRAFT_155531 [Aspergillus nidulans var. acristatus]
MCQWYPYHILPHPGLPIQARRLDEWEHEYSLVGTLLYFSFFLSIYFISFFSPTHTLSILFASFFKKKNL